MKLFWFFIKYSIHIHSIYEPVIIYNNIQEFWQKNAELRKISNLKEISIVNSMIVRYIEPLVSEYYCKGVFLFNTEEDKALFKLKYGL
jgi:hypothetical protein